MLERGSTSTQVRCLHQKDLAKSLTQLGFTEEESAEIAKAFWSQRPEDATMLGNSQSLVLGVGNQWIAATVLLVAVVGLVVAIALTGSVPP